MAVNQSIPTSVLNDMYFDAFYALDNSYMLEQSYVAELKSHNVNPSSLPLNLGEGGHFKKLKKTRGTSKDVKDFLTTTFTGAYALFLGTCIMLENSTSSLEKNHLMTVRTELVCILTRSYWQLLAYNFPVPKCDEKADKNKLRKRLKHLMNVFLQDKQVQALIPPFAGRKKLLLKWGLNIDYIVCFSDLMSKVKTVSARHAV